MNTVHEFLINKGVKSIGEQFTAHQIELWMEEYAKAYAPVKSYTKYLIENDKEEWYWIDFSEGMKPLPNKYGDTWTKDASQALQFDTLQEAEAYRKKYNLDYPQFKVTEHEFIAAPVPGKEEVGEWQLCPKCNGDGHLGRYNSPNMSTTATPLCDICNGAKILAKPKFASTASIKEDEQDELKNEFY